MNLGDTINGQALDPTKFNYVVQIFDNGLNGEVASSPDKARLLKTAVYSVDADSVTTIPGISSGIDFVHYSGMGVINTSYTLGIKDVNGTYRVYDINLQHRTIKISTNLENDILSGTAIRITKGEYDPNGTTIPGLDGAAEERTSSPFYTSYLTNSYLRRVFVTKDGKNILNRQLSTEVDFNVNWVLDLVTGQYSVATTNPVIDSSGDILSTVGSDEKEIPQIPGYKSYLVVDGVYTPATSIPADSVNIATQTLSMPEGLASLSKVVNIAYIADGQKLKFKAVDDDASGADITGKIGSTIATQMTGNSSAAVDLKQEQSDIDAIRRVLEAQNYEYVSNDDLIKNFDDDMSTDQELVIHFKHKQGNVVETKPVSRLINLHQPDGTTIKQEYQTGTATRTNTEDLVTGKVLTEGKWSGGLTQYQIPQLEGYISQVDNSGTRVDQSSIDGTSFKDSATVPTYDAIDVYYRNVPAYTVVNYKDADGNIIKSENIGGKVGDKVTVTADKIPDGYELVPGQDTSKEVTLTNDQPGQPKTPIVFNIQAKIVKVKHDAPKNAGDIIEKNFTYPQGVSEEDLNRSVTRTINVINPDGKTSTTSETVKFYRDATVNEVTGKVVYTDWQIASDSPQKSWSAFTTPNIKGYVPTITSLDAETPTAATGDKEYTITYTNQTYTTHVVFKDADGTVLRTQTITGVTGSTSNVDQTLPAGYKLKEGESIPSSITFNGDPVADKDITLEHDVVTLTDKTPDLPQGLTANDFKQDVSRTINVYDTTGQTITKTVNQTATFTRTATYDKATNKITFSNWQLADGSNKNFTAYTAPEIPGYTATTSVPAVTVDQTYGKQVVNIYYTPNDGKVIFKAYDQATGKDVAIDLDSLATNTELAGKVDSAVSATDASDREAKIKNLLDKLGYQYVENSATATPEKYTADTQTISLYFTHKTSETPEDKTVTRKINIPGENGKTIEVVQTATVHRTNTTDLVTGKTTPGDWSKASFPDYDAGQVDGHTTYVDGKETSTVPTAEVKIANGVPQNGDDVNVTYEANPGQQTIKYVDENGNPVKFSSDSDDQVITGKVGDIKTVNTTIPAGYELVPGETIPGAVDIKQSDSPIIVTLKAKTVTVTPDKPQNEGSEIPDNPGKTFPKGVSESDLNRTVTRKIIEDKPDGSVTVSDESVKFTRTAKVNIATGEVTYSDWTVVSPNKQFSEYTLGDSDQVTGYTASRTKVDSSTPSVEAGDQEIHITYTKTNQTTTINYIDTQNGDAIIHQTVITGRYGDKKEVPSEIPEGYELAKDSSVPGSIDFSKPVSNQTVKLVHKTTTYTGDEPKLPDGVVKTDLQKTVTRVVTVYEPDGKTVQSTKTDQATFKRTLTVDQVTGEFTWSPWTTSDKTTFDAVQGTEKTGYVAQSTPSVTVNENSSDMDIKLYYLPLTQKVTVEAYDNQTGKEVPLTIPAGFDKEITGNTNHEVPAQKLNDYIAALKGFFGDKGYKFVSQSTDPTNFCTKDQVIKLIFNHPGIDVSDTDPKAKKLVNRTITIKYPGGKTQEITQTAVATRTATMDPISKVVTYGDWTGGFKEFTAPVLPNYVSQVDGKDAESVPAIVFDKDHEPSDAKATIDYHTKPNTQTIKYINDRGEIVKTQTIDGYVGTTHEVTDATPTGYEVAKGFSVPGEVTIQPNDTPILIPVISKTVEVNHTDPKNPGDEIPNNPGKTFPDGVKETDLNRDVTRKIVEHKPSGDVTVQDQAVHFVRDATVNVATGEITYGEWKVEGERSHYDEYTLSLDDQVPGYIASRIKIDLSTPSADAGNQVIDVDYRPIQTIKFKAIDKSDNDQVIPLKNASLATLISGEGGDKIDDKQVYSYVQAIRSELEPRGYDFINYDNIPELIKEIKDGVINVYFKHQIVPVKPGEGKTPEEPVRPGDPESPKYPQGVENNDLTTPITRTINVKYPAGYSDGGSNAEHTETQTQVVQYKRTALVDKVTGKFLGYTDGEAIGTDTWSEYVPDVAKGYGLTKESEQAPEVHVKANDKDVVVNMEIVPLPQKLIVKAYDAGKKVVVEVPFNGVTYQNIDSETVKKTVDEALKEKGYTADWTSVEIPTRYDNDVDVDQIVELHTNLIPTPVTPENPKTNKGNKTPELPAKSTGKHDEPKTTTPLTPEANIPNKDVAKKITSSSTKLPQTGNDNSSAAGLGLAAMAVASLIGLAGKRKKDEKNK
ncbi:mucin-binding protein [Lactobacillus jensenii]|uniref:mucin-binding protein n=1 Tax=Lactobacillus jensenii TaxID=109790 RepID=UPI0028ED76B3|nr:MucBP domain-containing protein [Lactobacillus jensenii]MDT9619363.1 MucBP domain-containing protein [Lactobacillus jensenii]